MIEITRSGASYCRNSSDLKLYLRSEPQPAAPEPHQSLHPRRFEFLNIDDLYALWPDRTPSPPTPLTPDATINIAGRLRSSREANQSIQNHEENQDRRTGHFQGGGVAVTTARASTKSKAWQSMSAESTQKSGQHKKKQSL